jgi:hypothetical protein
MEILAVIIAGLVVLAVVENRNGMIAGTIAPANIQTPAFPMPNLGGGGYGAGPDGQMIAVGANLVDQGVKSNSSISPGLAGGIIAGVGIIAGIASSLLAAHEARLHGATNENNAALQIVPVYDSFVRQLAAAYNAGKVSKAETAQTFAKFDAVLYQRLRSLVGAAGTAWSDSAGMAGKCDKTCTVSCCLYFSDLGPPLSLARLVLGDRGGRWGASDPRLSGRTITVPKVWPGKYSSFSRESYKFTLK